MEDNKFAKVYYVAVPTRDAIDEYPKVETYIGKPSMPKVNLNQAEMEMLTDGVDLILHANVEGSFFNSY